MKDFLQLKDRTVLITGGTKGIGRQAVSQFAEHGCIVYFTGRNTEEIQEINASYKRQNLPVYGIKSDISHETDRKELVDILSKEQRHLDILVNNAGINIRKSTEEYTLQDYESVMQTNLAGAWDLTRLLQSLLKKSGQGSIISIGSTAASRVISSSTAVYGMSKAAMEQMTRFFSVEYAKSQIRVNCIAPWYIETPLTESVLENEVFREKILAHTPLNRIGKPEDIVHAILFLASPASSFITGITLPVDGGFFTLGF